MKLFLLVLVNFIFINNVCSQTVIEIEIGSKKKVIKVDVTGAFADGDTAWRKLIIKKDFCVRRWSVIKWARRTQKS